jgi:hypothetical protein
MVRTMDRGPDGLLLLGKAFVDELSKERRWATDRNTVLADSTDIWLRNTRKSLLNVS